MKIIKKLALTILTIVTGAILHGALPHTQIQSEQLIAVPSFENCSVYFKTDDNSGTRITEFKEKKSEKWQRAFDLVYQEADKILRGSIVNLQEDSEYEVRLTHKREEKTDVYVATFKTWSSNPPIAKVINIRASSAAEAVVINTKGTPDGWVKYTATKDTVLKGSKKNGAVILLEDARYVILEGLTIEGGDRFGIEVLTSQYIRIINCDISGWGRVGQQDLSKDGKYYDEKTGRAINFDAAININQSGNVLVERCYLHDPRGRANSWRYSHPAGVEGITVRSTGNIVLRYNDLIGSDPHRWNDAIEGWRNGVEEGGFYRDSDIYGNMLAFGNDDGIEIDGGQMNIRVYKNKFEGFLCGVSTGPCLLGPSYTFRNLIVNLGDEDGLSVTAFKNSHGRYGLGQIFFFNNTTYGDFYVMGSYGDAKKPNPEMERLKGMTRNNLFYCKKFIRRTEILERKNDFDYDLIWSGWPNDDRKEKPELIAKGLAKHSVFDKPKFISEQDGNFGLKSGSKGINQGTIIPNFTESFNDEAPDIGAFEYGRETSLPYRPIPIVVDKSQLNFETQQGISTPEQIVTAKVNAGTPYSHKFTVVKNKVFDWFTVEPVDGVFKDGQEIKFKVRLNHDKLPGSKLLRGLFLLRQENGYSRPVTVYAKIKGEQNIKKEGAGFYYYIEAEKPTNKQIFNVIDDNDASEGKCVYLKGRKHEFLFYEFEVPKDGEYRMLLRVKSEEPVGSHDSIFMSIDGGEVMPLYLRSTTDWIWANVNWNKGFNGLIKLKEGKHSIKISPRKSIFMDLIVITNDIEFTDTWR